MTTIESPSGFTEEIKYDPESKDYMMLLDGELRGYARSYHEAEVTLDQLVYDLLQSDLHRSASELDGGSGADEIAADMARNALPKCDGVYSERWSKPGDLPCQNDAFYTHNGANICTICAPHYQEAHPQAILRLISACRDNAYMDMIDNEIAADVNWNSAPSQYAHAPCVSCGASGGRHMCAPDGVTIRCVTCGAIWRAALCPSCGDALTGDEPRCTACRESEPLTLPQAIALAVGDPAPPVDDGPDDNWGGFRAPRQVGG